MVEEKRFVVKTDPAFHKRVKLAAVQQDLHLSYLMRALLEKWLEGKIEIKPEQPSLFPESEQEGDA